jgi:16S rRNA processing protein RimM
VKTAPVTLETPVAEDNDFITVGRLGKTRGVDGELYVLPLTDFPDRFLDLTEIYVEHRGVWEKFRIDSSRMVSGRPVIRFAQIETPENAALLTNRHLAVTRDRLVKLPKGSYYIFDLVGCTMVEAATKAALGEVTDVRQFPANDAYVVRRPNGQEVLFPAVRQFVKKVDIAGRIIEVDSGGLFDDDRKPDQ